MTTLTIDIRRLDGLDLARFREIASGYVSAARYVVRKTETAERTVISLELAALDVPYVKRWDAGAESDRRRMEIAGLGFSAGAYVDGRLAGAALAEPQQWNRALWIHELHVDEAWRGQGIGQGLIAWVAADAERAGLRILVCETQSTNVPAIAFYRRAGFEIDGVDLSYYSNEDMADGEVAIFMKRKIGTISPSHQVAFP